MSRKIHIGCGSVYLMPSVLSDQNDGWINVDVRGAKRFLANNRPDLVVSLGVTEDKYYSKSPKQKIRDFDTPLKGDSVCDQYGTFFDMGVPASSVSEVLARQVFEHMSVTEAKKALLECDRVLEPGGVLRIDVPDHDETVKKLLETKDEFWPRHLFGSKKDDYGYHVMSYTKESLQKFIESIGFVYEEEEENIHVYPAFCLRFRKLPIHRSCWEYIMDDITIKDGWKCAEVGGGGNPWPKAEKIVDINPEAKTLEGQELIVRDAIKLPFGDDEYDYISSFHCMEHVDDPVAYISEMSRVAKRGTIVCPSKFKEALFGFDETDHKWWVSIRGDTLVFEKVDPDFVSQMRNEDFQKAMHRLWRLGPAYNGMDSIIARRWFYDHEKLLDTVYHWEGEAKVEVLE